MTDTRYPHDPSPGNAGPDDPPPFRCWKCGGRKLVENRLDDETVDCATCGETYETKDLE